MIYWKLFYTFFIINAFAFGGGYAMIPLIEQQVVANGFLTVEQVADVIAISEMTPGPFAVNSATFAGMKTAGILGGAVATLGVALPAMIYSIIVAKYYFKFENNKLVQDALYGIRPITVALIGYAIVTMGWQTIVVTGLSFNVDLIAIALGTIVLVCMKVFKLSPITCLIISGILGLILYSVF